MTDKYIKPITKIHSTFAEAKDFFDKFGGISIFEDEGKLDINALTQGKRNLIVGEPGIGKSLLLQKIKEHLEKGDGVSTTLISLRETNALQQIDECLSTKGNTPKALLLDALDEIKSSLFPIVLQKIEEVSKKYPDLPLFISGRWVFVSRYANSFPDFRFISISPFTRSQIREYLISAGRSEQDVDTLLNRIMSFGHRMLVIQIPRYLSYLDDFLKEKGVDAAAKVSRNELFEYFIYKKLELEEKKLNEDKRAITKRVLEKLALTMETYQTNVITKDELMTFFDDLKSDLKLAALSQIGIEVFYEYSLLKVSQDNLDKIEFENTEFQEYLAAKEITRFADPNRTAFAFAVDPNVKEIYPTWFNALTFLVDMQPNLLEQLIEFSGLHSGKFKILDESFFHFLSRVDPRNISVTLRTALFKSVVEYHCRTRQWMPGQITQALPDFYDPSLEPLLKTWIAETEPKNDAYRFVPLGNIAYVVAYLLRSHISLDTAYWRQKLITYTKDKNENGVLQRHALQALEELHDPSVIDELTELVSSDELVSQAFLSMCIGLNPDHPKTLEFVFNAVSRGDFHGRYGLYEFKKAESVKAFLKRYNEDEAFRREFLDHASIFRDKDGIIVDLIKATADAEVREMCKETLVKSVHYNVAHNAEESVFLQKLWDFLRKDDPNFVLDMVKRIKESEDGKTSLYFAHNFFANTIEVEDVKPYVQAMIDAGEKYSAFTVMTRIKFSKRPNAQEIYEAGRSLLIEDYKKWEEGQTKSATAEQNERAQGLLSEFRVLLEPEPGKYSNNVFDFFNDHAQQLNPLLTESDRKRIEELLTGTVFKFCDPGNHGLTITAEHEGSKTYTTNSTIRLFGDAIKTAKHIGFDVAPYRQQVLNLIPFAYTEELQTIFELVKDIKPNEMSKVFEVYKNRNSDLWRYMPESFIGAVKQYHVIEAAPILEALIMEPMIEKHARQEALTVLDSVASNPVFLKEVVEKYKDNVEDGEKKIAHIANGLLITTHADADAIRWRLQQVVERASAFIQKTHDVHWVNDLEDEISHSKTFARPLMELKYNGYENDYLSLLENAMGIWARGKEFHAYGEYLWEIVYAYFDNLKEYRSYKPLQMLESAIAGMEDRDGANWLAGRMVNLRRSYLGYLGKPRNISEAITKYNDAREYSDKKIRNSEDLYHHVQDALEVDLRRWIEGEGAYDLILGHSGPEHKRREYEKLIQKTLKTQIENILLKRGFQVEIVREPQLLDEKRVDFLVCYGFAGPIVIEVKLTSNKDIRGSKIEGSASYTVMKKEYMEGYGASHGIFLVINNTNARNIPQIKEIFQKIKNVSVVSFDCYKSPTAPKTTSRKQKTTSKIVKSRKAI